MNNYNEPVYNDEQFAMIEEQQVELLIGELVDCIIELCNTAAELRIEVNELTQKINPQAPPTYYEIHSNLVKSFEDSPAYARFEKQLERLIDG